MNLSTYTQSIGKKFNSCRMWHRFARGLVKRGLVERYDRTVRGRIIDGYLILDLEKLKTVVRGKFLPP